MKKALLLLFTVFTFSLANAQEKQSDATIEETVEFLQKFGIPNLIFSASVNSTEDMQELFKTKKGIVVIGEYIIVSKNVWESIDVKGKYITAAIGKQYYKVSNVYSNEISKMIFDKDRSYYYIRFVSPNNSNKIKYPLDELKMFEKAKKAFEHLFFLLDEDIDIIDKTSLESKF